MCKFYLESITFKINNYKFYSDALGKLTDALKSAGGINNYLNLKVKVSNNNFYPVYVLNRSWFLLVGSVQIVNQNQNVPQNSVVG